MARIHLDGIEKRYLGGTVALGGITLDIADGELVCLVGPSGCGKSTLLAVVAGLERPTAGTVRIDDADVTARSPGERDLAMVFQSYALYPHLRVRENLAFPLEVAGRPRAEIRARVEETAALLELTPLLERRPRELSGGQRQRVALGRALVRRPRAFLFDEPLSNLDPALRTDVRGELKKLHERLGATFLYVTHDQTEAMTLADRIVVLRGGAIQQVGTPREIYDRPANLFVAQFFGAPALGVVPAEVLGLPVPSVTGALAGIRPEHVEVGLGPPPTYVPGVLEARVYLVEPVGAETWVTVELASAAGAHRLVARAPAAFAARPGEPAWLRVDPARVLAFDPRTGHALYSAGGAA